MNPSPEMTNQLTGLQRRRWQVRGQVQGVGFRPRVYRLARMYGLSGWVRNDAEGLVIEAQGPAAQLEAFDRALRKDPPPLAVIDTITSYSLAPLEQEGSFRILHSTTALEAAAAAEVTVDTAVCSHCLQEMFDPTNRRYRHALITCTDCGPRFSIVVGIPYDRPNTTMAGFAMCSRCQAEYENPADRRFHAQPIACPDCGPQLRLLDPQGNLLEPQPDQAVSRAAQLLIQGRILAIKATGGYHLAVRADDQDAVLRLRRLKRRDHKPFAIMVRDLDLARRLVYLSEPAQKLMTSPVCPIILAPCTPQAANLVAPAVAPGTHRLGLMLPNTPLQHLLMKELEGPGGVAVLVMTSANYSDEPLVYRDQEALDRLGRAGLCDAILLHDRPIQRPVDDSVILQMEEPAFSSAVGEGGPKTDPSLVPVRRARGYVPRSLAVGAPDSPPGLCVGGELKNTVAIVRAGRAILSQHLGDLTHASAFDHFCQAIGDLCRLFEVRPAWIAHDLHPMYLSTQYARQLSRSWNVPLIPVQHHHAHAAAVLAEHGLDGPVIAIVCDGTGYGPDGSIWGGEILRLDRRDFQRLACLRPIPLAGGDAAAKDTRRCALGLIRNALGPSWRDHPCVRRLLPEPTERQMLIAMLDSSFQCAFSSGAGRYFDGFAALLGLCPFNHFEAQAPLALEAAAWGQPLQAETRLLFDLIPSDGDGPLILDPGPLVRQVLEALEHGQPVAGLAALVHDQLAAALSTAAAWAARRGGLNQVVLSGGVFCNQRLTIHLVRLLRSQGLDVLWHQQVPPNDGGLALGQAAVALARFGAKNSSS